MDFDRPVARAVLMQGLSAIGVQHVRFEPADRVGATFGALAMPSFATSAPKSAAISSYAAPLASFATTSAAVQAAKNPLAEPALNVTKTAATAIPESAYQVTRAQPAPSAGLPSGVAYGVPGGGGTPQPQPQPQPQPEPEPEPVYVQPAPPPVAGPAQAPPDLSRCVRVDQGGATALYLCPPNVVISGKRRYRARFLGTVTTPLNLMQRPDAQWTSAVGVPFDLGGGILSRGRPFPLVQGKTHVGRVFSRDKKAASRGDVTTLLDAMGFDDPSVFLLRRNVHLPGKAAALSEWLVAGVWARPSSVVTVDEPFFFESLIHS